MSAGSIATCFRNVHPCPFWPSAFQTLYRAHARTTRPAQALGQDWPGAQAGSGAMGTRIAALDSVPCLFLAWGMRRDRDPHDDPAPARSRPRGAVPVPTLGQLLDAPVSRTRAKTSIGPDVPVSFLNRNFNFAAQAIGLERQVHGAAELMRDEIADEG